MLRFGLARCMCLAPEDTKPQTCPLHVCVFLHPRQSPSVYSAVPRTHLSVCWLARSCTELFHFARQNLFLYIVCLMQPLEDVKMLGLQGGMAAGLRVVAECEKKYCYR